MLQDFLLFKMAIILIYHAKEKQDSTLLAIKDNLVTLTVLYTPFPQNTCLRDLRFPIPCCLDKMTYIYVTEVIV